MKEKITVHFLTGVAMMTVVGCTHLPREKNQPNKKEIEGQVKGSSAFETQGQEGSKLNFEEPIGVISMLDAFAAALLNHPKLNGYSWELRAQEAQALQARLLPNPEFEIEVEDFGGSGSASGFDSSETTLFFSQLVELGQKRRKRHEVARLEHELATWDYETVRVEVLAEVSKAFISLLAYQERQVMMQQNLELAQSSFDAIEKSVEAGAVTPLDLTKARVVVAQEKLELQRNQRELDVVRNNLAIAWGGEYPKFDHAEGNLFLIANLPTFEALSSQIALNPHLARWAVEVSKRQAQVKYEQSQSKPDLNVGLGVKYQNESEDTSAVFGFTMPLALFDRNQGNVRAAQYGVERAQQRKREIELYINASLANSYRRLQATHEEAVVMEEELLPAAQQAHSDIRKAYIAGKLGYLDVLDAQRTLFETQKDLLEVLVRFHSFAVEIESLIGAPLSEIIDQQPHSIHRAGE